MAFAILLSLAVARQGELAKTQRDPARSGQKPVAATDSTQDRVRFGFPGAGIPANVPEIGDRVRDGIGGRVGISRKTREKALQRSYCETSTA